MFRRCEGGQSIVETALLLPVLAVMLVGTLEGVRLLLAVIALTGGVMAGAQYGALSTASSNDTAGIASAVRAETTPIGGTGTNPTVTTVTGTDGTGERFVSVTAVYTWSSLFQYPGLPRTVTVTRVALLQVRR